MQLKTAAVLGFAFAFVLGAPAMAKTASAGAASTHAHGVAAAQTAVKKTAGRATRRHHRSGGRGYRTTAGFIPPPPAYMPSILPEIAARRMQGLADSEEQAEGEGRENPYRKYIYERQGEAPTALEERKGVVTWARRN